MEEQASFVPLLVVVALAFPVPLVTSRGSWKDRMSNPYGRVFGH
jgi:hypothetical protein